MVVFESGVLRALHEGFAREEAEGQLLWTLHRAADHARAVGMRVGIEPSSRRATDIVKGLGETAALVERLERKEVGIVAHIGQMPAEGEALERLVQVGRHLLHVHVAATGSAPPGEGRGDFGPLFETLARANYDSRVSIECTWEDFAAEAPKAITYLKGALER